MFAVIIVKIKDMVKRNLKLIYLMLVGFCFSNCEHDIPESGSSNYPQAFSVQTFDWEAVSWMPTPP